VNLGDYVFTLPWVLTTQDNATALVNNLRRVRSRRRDVGVETKRIENRLADQMQQQGFRTLVGYTPVEGEGEPAGEIDLLATRDGHLFVFEIKSGFVRQTLEAAWHHRTNTLRKAGRQLQRKLAFVRQAFAEAVDLRDALRLESIPPPERVHPRIVDTSIDFDRERFSGYLKVSMTEFLVALRDETALLGDDVALETLYPDGFCAGRFAQVIEREAMWEKA
jgi:predicted RecB family endonuclease